jgi:hypothetical protein
MAQKVLERRVKGVLAGAWERTEIPPLRKPTRSVTNEGKRRPLVSLGMTIGVDVWETGGGSTKPYVREAKPGVDGTKLEALEVKMDLTFGEAGRVSRRWGWSACSARG